jgi:hypothetical protein
MIIADSGTSFACPTEHVLLVVSAQIISVEVETKPRDYNDRHIDSDTTEHEWSSFESNIFGPATRE